VRERRQASITQAVGTGWAQGITWVDIEIRNDVAGKPTITLDGAAREIADELGIGEMLISISHCRSHATAYALAKQKT
jgi:holo-[acyl-carrier protein] synthase